MSFKKPNYLHLNETSCFDDINASLNSQMLWILATGYSHVRLYYVFGRIRFLQIFLAMCPLRLCREDLVLQVYQTTTIQFVVLELGTCTLSFKDTKGSISMRKLRKATCHRKNSGPCECYFYIFVGSCIRPLFPIQRRIVVLILLPILD